VTSGANNAEETGRKTGTVCSVEERLTDGTAMTETLADREKDIKQALQWIRQELVRV